MNIKKQYEAIYAILEANRNKKVSTIMPLLAEVMTAKQAQKNFITNDDGEVTHVFCYYHKKWEDVTVAEYGKKASSASGLASMCKEGVSSWNKQQKRIKSIDQEVLNLVMTGEVPLTNIQSWKEAQIEQAKVIIDRLDGHSVDL